jgi:hypothetical protein
MRPLFLLCGCVGLAGCVLTEEDWRAAGAIGVEGLFDAVAPGFEPMFEGSTVRLDVQVSDDSFEQTADGWTEWLDVQWYTDNGE